MYCKLVYSQKLCEIDFDLPEPVESNASTGRGAKNEFNELEVIIILVTLTVINIVTHRRKTSLSGRHRRWHQY